MGCARLRCLLLLSLVAVSIGIATDAAAADRRGFIFGVGAGPMFITDTSDWRQVLFELRLGHGINDQWLVYYKGLTAMGSGPFVGLGISLFPTVGTTYYFRPTAPSFFATGGLSWWLADSDKYGESGSTLSGPGAYAGVGWEPLRHLEVETAYYLGVFPSRDAAGGFWTLALRVQTY